MENPKYYVCRHCGNVVELLYDSGVAVVCCGEPMETLQAGTSDGAVEKHLPVISQTGQQVRVQVGSTAHPMLAEHYIGWIWLQTKQGGQRKNLGPANAPEAVFHMAPDDEVVAAWAWCNIHGLWRADG